MKKDRNCNSGIAYPTMTGYNMAIPMAPGMMIPTPVPPFAMGGVASSDMSGSTYTSGTSMDQLQTQINNLDRRVSRLESMMQDTKTSTFTNNNYTDSNYHMM